MTTRVATLFLVGVFFCSSGFGRDLVVDIAPGSLEEALNAFSQVMGLQILYDPALVRGRVSRGVKGTLSPHAALSKLLANTDIAFSFTGDDAVALFRKSEPSATGGPEMPLSPRTVTISTDRASEQTYNVRTSLAASKVDESSMIVPLASQSLTQAILRDRQVNRLQDALEYISGSEAAPNGQSALGFQIRGLPTYQYYLDGVRVSPDQHHDGFRDMANVERIEVIKGPASMLYGRTEPGGAINLVTKQPLTQPHINLEQQTGSFGRKRTQLDAGGPVPDEDDLYYRFNAAYEDQNSFRGIHNRRIFLAPVVQWNLSEATAATLYAEFLNSHDSHDSGLPVIGNQLPAVPVSRSLESGSEVHTSDFRVGLKGAHTFSDDWLLTLHLDGRWTQSPRSPGIAISDDGLDPSACTPASCPVQRKLVSIPVSHGFTTFVSADIRRDLNLWSMRHSLLVGIDGFISVEYSELYTKGDSSLATDLFNPRDNIIPVALLSNPEWSAHNRTAERWAGVYLQDRIQLLDTLYFLAGGRFDYVDERIDGIARSDNSLDSGYATIGWFNTSGVSHRVQAFKVRGGLLWHPTSSLSLYANYIQNFGVTAGLYYSGNNDSQQLFLPAEIAEQWEGGVKLEMADGRASATLAVFDLTKKNISSPVLEPAIDNSNLQYLMDRVNNLGVEADIQGELLPGLQLLASYAYINSWIHNVPYSWYPAPPKGYEVVGETGNRLAGVPRHGASLWSTYRIRHGMLHGLKVGFGAVARGVREGDNANDYQLPAFVKCNAVAAYDWRTAGADFTLQLNVDNMFDKRYFESLSGTRTVVPGAPRNWLATLSVSF